MRGAQRTQTEPKCRESLELVREAFMEEVTTELNFNVESDLKGERPSKYMVWITVIFT